MLRTPRTHPPADAAAEIPEPEHIRTARERRAAELERRNRHRTHRRPAA